MRRALTYTLLFAGVFAATVWIRLSQRDEPAPTATTAERAEAAGTPPAARLPAPLAAPSDARETTSAAGQPADAGEDPRDAIAGDEYPVNEQYGTASAPPAPGALPGGAPEPRPAPPPAPAPFDPVADAQRDEIAGDIYPHAPDEGATRSEP